MTRSIERMAIVGTGVMGTGIAQIAVQAGIQVQLFDAREGAAQAACDNLKRTFDKLVEKGKIPADEAQAAVERLQVATALERLSDAQLVVEAIIERLDIKQKLLAELEVVVAAECILATNTSSLSVTSIARNCRHPERVAGFHFFNPVPLMKVVEVIDGLATDPAVGDCLQALATRMGHRGIRAKDTPGFIINHAGRAYSTEALQILKEGVAEPADIDRILREGMGFRMGPLELFDLTALDVSHPVIESIYNQFYQDPRYRPAALTRLMLEAGHVGRKVGRGFYRYQDGQMIDAPAPQLVPTVQVLPPVWIGAENEQDGVTLGALVQRLGGRLERGEHPSEEALCLLAPYGRDASSACLRFGTDPARTICIDMLLDLQRHRCLMQTPATAPIMREAAHALLAGDGVGVTVINDSVGFVAQRVMAMIVNLAGDIVQQRISTVDDLDEGVRRGLGYPHGPLAWGDELGAKRLLEILERMSYLTGDPRYRPGPWLRRRAELGLSLRQPEPALA
ncbi:MULTISPECIES: 3-hydroxyacyl-CoA dehydrogenase [Pseudomonas]|uniref:3-hydroxyacyl-CoA dehydrogenase n=1 Tax=Pseudomonas taiwanensis SJ9 TaxID=1388762 RepID=V7D3B1_9PSED|nr:MULTISPECIES: 3-hydroxyacyl-CoA dehydrogenase [Pseudomonas]AVZ17478.1 3-hydroxyacyl-CoA dehydrogenase [Pseudomonas aeruginosa]ESW36050.1 3-hydroxyacyl-CoA dehydrogenase [Pseudomonas taiwanensis SJ9]MCM8589388.1 3-hydroxyacyl-CoA dehydrogenase [Pseudomonas aeruginosa]MCM8673299.1 3-hydroxyacyl-CoA dehydrogenase [Pseudomonas aeruginosa]MCP2653246.1 3-hydroxyacyl-CoA dehydrogenase [Pseudomonas aeruginosa]